MTNAVTTTKVHISSLVSLRLVNAVENIIARFSSWNDNRRTFNQLSKLSDRELHDIGLNRGDVYTLSGK